MWNSFEFFIKKFSIHQRKFKNFPFPENFTNVEKVFHLKFETQTAQNSLQRELKCNTMTARYNQIRNSRE